MYLGALGRPGRAPRKARELPRIPGRLGRNKTSGGSEATSGHPVLFADVYELKKKKKIMTWKRRVIFCDPFPVSMFEF